MEPHQRIAQARKQKGLTQEELSELCNITVRTVQRIENGDSRPRAFTLKAIATALDINWETLMAPDRHAQDNMEPESPATQPDQDAGRDFLQLLCLSCFSYLLIPFVHFLIPASLLKKSNLQDPALIAWGKKLIRLQLYWQVCLHLLLFCTLAYNLTMAGYFHSSNLISYLLPFFAMYFVNACIIAVHLFRVQTMHGRFKPAV